MTPSLIIAPQLAPAQQIRQFQQFRWGLIITEYLAALLAFVLDYPVSNWPLLLLLLTLHGCSNLVLPLWPGSQRFPQRLFILGVLADLLILTLLLALTGGASNGFIALLLLPVAVCAVLLPALQAYLCAILAVTCYALLLQLGQSMEHHGHQMHLMAQQPFNQHLLQMGWAFSLSALLIAWFISAQAQLISQKSRQLDLLQQQQSRQEQMLAVATYAANAAHDLATPLQNLTLLSDELAQLNQQTAPDPALLTDLQTEVARCQQIVQQLRLNAQQLRSQKGQSQPVLHVTQQAIQLWLVSRPDICIAMSCQQDESACQLQDALAWSAALFNILDNAADASLANQRAELQLELTLQQGLFCCNLTDFGNGLTEPQLAELGLMPQPSRQGLGLGQLLANASIERLGGHIQRANLPQGGMLTVISYRSRA
jgi:two-component system sensor histidine kinase RegB